GLARPRRAESANRRLSAEPRSAPRWIACDRPWRLEAQKRRSLLFSLRERAGANNGEKQLGSRGELPRDTAWRMDEFQPLSAHLASAGTEATSGSASPATSSSGSSRAGT